MKRYDQANMEILFDLFRWKKQAGEIIRFEITERSTGWVVSFVSTDPLTDYQHIFASFLGDTHEDLHGWCLTILTDFTISFGNNPSFSQVPAPENNEAPTLVLS
ncbi:hypothetical protein [Aneurinibacillus terranovensis]|uniref:hypothetical protein n=1 Tax=Aneurinibacillus terranovensis TaxID=278991 RepID=UPI0012DE3CA7|nr:hypothetical protein [Aneurinibacillus terranovensis]